MSDSKEIPSSTSISCKISSAIGNTVVSGLEFISQMSLGQGILKLCDRTLWVVEKSTQWSLPAPQSTSNENGQIFGQVELVKPLPWVFFLPTLIILRATRFAINVGAFILGRPQIEPKDVISAVQKARRRLRTIKSHGIKVIREKNGENVEKERVIRKARTNLFRSILLTISTLFCLGGNKMSHSPLPTRILVGSLHEMETTREDKAEEAENESKKTDSKRKYEEAESSDESSDEEVDEKEQLMEKIDRLAAENSEDDEDYVPNEKEGMDSDKDTESASEVDEVDVSESEILKLINDKEDFEKSCERVNSKGHYSEEKYEYDGDVTFYSPISSTSDSPERSGTPIKSPKEFDNRQGVNKSHASSENGNMLYVAPCSEDKSILSDDGTNDNVRNGRNEERKHGKGNKSSHKNKRNNCASRKKK